MDGIEAFHPDRMASRILGMGDVLSLIEKAEQSYDEKKRRGARPKAAEKQITLADFYDQLVQIKSMGSLSEIASMLPGVSGKALSGLKWTTRRLRGPRPSSCP
jgi:signal recognition particle subunit SRP54